MDRKQIITILFYLSGVANIVGMLVFSQGFTSKRFLREYPAVFGVEGCIGVMLWGLAYIACARSFVHVPWICAVFTIEKLFYVGTWFHYMDENFDVIGILMHYDRLAGAFFIFYGLNDLFFAIVFAYAFVYARGYKAEPPKTKAE
eukprot:TRINITY_DN7437_c0_g1_i1.p1 TRINITY_DN7437_c0_g1~~TRINITY_DN7437_c0_g1_i1.p1  ORF type:complete len:145 (+),score=51.98 TRINITY_DN7437_c0_g1_i1:159-593(+)